MTRSKIYELEQLQPVYIFDFDRTLCWSPDTIYPKVNQLQPMPRVYGKLEELADAGARFSVFSNQGGIEAGHKTKEEVVEYLKRGFEFFPQIEKIYFSPGLKAYWTHWVYPNGMQDEYHSNTSCGGIVHKPYPWGLRFSVQCWEYKCLEQWGGTSKQCQFYYIGDRMDDFLAIKALNKLEGTQVEFIWADDFFPEYPLELDKTIQFFIVESEQRKYVVGGCQEKYVIPTYAKHFGIEEEDCEIVDSYSRSLLDWDALTEGHKRSLQFRYPNLEV